MNDSNGNFKEYRLLILDQIKVCREGIKSLDEKMDLVRNDVSDRVGKIKVEVAMLKVKSGLWGAAAGMIPVAIVMVMMYLKASPDS